MGQGDITGSNLVPALGRLAARRGFPMGYAATGGDPALWRDRVLPHLRALILPDLPKAEVARLTRAVPDNVGRTLIEIFSGPAFTARAASLPLTGAGVGILEAAHREGCPVVLGTPWFSRDMQVLYFTRCVNSGSGDDYCKLMISRRTDGIWEEPETNYPL